MGQTKEETTPMFGIVGWFKSIVKKDKPAGGTSVTPSSPRRSTSRKRVAAVESLQVTIEASPLPENTAALKFQPNNVAQQRPQTWLEAGKRSLRDSDGDSRPRRPGSLDISNRAEGPQPAAPTTCTSSSQAAAVCDSEHAQSVVLAIQTPQQQWQLQRLPSKRATYLLELAKSVDFDDDDDGDDEATKAKPTGGRTPVEVLDPKGMQQSFVASSWLNDKRIKEPAHSPSKATPTTEQKQAVVAPVIGGLPRDLSATATPGSNNNNGGPLLLPRRAPASTVVTTGYTPAATAGAWRQGGGNLSADCSGKGSGGDGGASGSGKGSGVSGSGVAAARVSFDENRGAPLKDGKGAVQGSPSQGEKQPGGGLVLSVNMPGQPAVVAPLQLKCSGGILPFRITSSEIEESRSVGIAAATADPGRALKKTISAVSTAFRGPSGSSVPTTAAGMTIEPVNNIVDADMKILRLSSCKEALDAGEKSAAKPLHSCLVIHEERSSNTTTRWETETGMEERTPGNQQDPTGGSKRDDVARWLVALPEPWGPSGAGAASRAARPRSRQPLGPNNQPVDALTVARNIPQAKSLAHVREAHGYRWYSLVQPSGPGQHNPNRFPVPSSSSGNGGSSFLLPMAGMAAVNATTTAVPAKPDKARSFGTDGAQKMDAPSRGVTVVAVGSKKEDVATVMSKRGVGSQEQARSYGVFGSFGSGTGNLEGRLPGCWNEGVDSSGHQALGPSPPPPPPTPWQKAPQRQVQPRHQNGNVNVEVTSSAVNRIATSDVFIATQQTESTRQQGAFAMHPEQQQQGSEPQPHQRTDRKARGSRGIAPLEMPFGPKTASNTCQDAIITNNSTQRSAQNGSQHVHKHDQQQHQDVTTSTTGKPDGGSCARGEDSIKGRRKQPTLHVRIAMDPSAADGDDRGLLGQLPSSGRRTCQGDGVRMTEEGDNGIFGWDDQAPAYLPAHRLSNSSQSSTKSITAQPARSGADGSGKSGNQGVRASPRSSTIRPSLTGGLSSDNNAIPADNGDLSDVYGSNSRALAAQAPLMRTARPRQSKPSMTRKVESLGTAALNPLTWQQQSVLSPTGSVATHMFSKRSTRDGESGCNTATSGGFSRRTSGALQLTGATAAATSAATSTATATATANNNNTSNRVGMNGGGVGGATGGTLLQISQNCPTAPITPAGRFFRASQGYGGATALFSIVSFRSRVENGDGSKGSDDQSGELEVD